MINNSSAQLLKAFKIKLVNVNWVLYFFCKTHQTESIVCVFDQLIDVNDHISYLVNKQFDHCYLSTDLNIY